MTRFARALAGSLLVSIGNVAQVLADERVHGVVRRIEVTHCDATKAGGCAGTLTMERLAAGTTEALSLRVPLGTPISCGSDTVHLHTLQGRPVVVTLVTGGNGRVARAIQVAEAEPC